MIEHLTHERIDPKAWEERLARSRAPLWYARSAVLDIACPGWDALLHAESGAMMPLPWKRKFGIRYVHTPFLLQQLGPFAPVGGEGACTGLLSAIPKAFKYVDIGTALAAGPVEGFRLFERTNVVLPLGADATALRAAYSTGHRRNVRKAERSGVRIDNALDPHHLEAFLVGSEQFRRWRIKPEALRTMAGLLHLCAAEGNGRFVGARYQGEVVAAAAFVEWQGRLIFLKGLSNAEGRTVGAMHALLDAVIAAHAGKDLLLDFAGYLRALANRLPPVVRRLKP